MLSPAVRAWERGGSRLHVGGHEIFVARTPGEGVPVLVVHGYPGSSYDFARVLPRLGRPTLALDLLGYGLSDKPTSASYSLFEQADLVEAVADAQGVDRCVLLAHDMGTTVAAELLARARVGRLGFAVEQVFLTNGSIFIDLAQLTRGQRLGVRLTGRAPALPLPSAFLRRSVGESIAPGTQFPADALDDLVALIRHRSGDRVLVRQIAYLAERRRHQEAWTAAFVDYPGPLTAVWGVLDPIAVPAMPERLAALRPATEVVWLDGVGHWPSIEAPERLATEIRDRL